MSYWIWHQEMFGAKFFVEGKTRTMNNKQGTKMTTSNTFMECEKLWKINWEKLIEAIKFSRSSKIDQIAPYCKINFQILPSWYSTKDFVLFSFLVEIITDISIRDWDGVKKMWKRKRREKSRLSVSSVLITPPFYSFLYFAHFLTDMTFIYEFTQRKKKEKRISIVYSFLVKRTMWTRNLKSSFNYFFVASA